MQKSMYHVEEKGTRKPWQALEQAMKEDDKEHIAPSMCYAYAALSEGCPFIMGAPNTTVDIPAMWELD